MTKITIRIDHKNLPLTSSNTIQMSPNEIELAVSRFGRDLGVFVDDDALTITTTATTYSISSSLDRSSLIAAIEQALDSLKLGGQIIDTKD